MGLILALFLGFYANRKASADRAAKEVCQILVSEGYTKAGACGMLGNMYAESHISSCIRQGADANDRRSKEYTKEVDGHSVTGDEFSNDGVGYGIIGFTHPTLKSVLYDEAVLEGKSIGNLRVQLNALIRILKEDYPKLDETLRNSSSAAECAREFAYKLEKSASLLGYNGAKAKLKAETDRVNAAERYYKMFENL